MKNHNTYHPLKLELAIANQKLILREKLETLSGSPMFKASAGTSKLKEDGTRDTVYGNFMCLFLSKKGDPVNNVEKINNGFAPKRKIIVRRGLLSSIPKTVPIFTDNKESNDLILTSLALKIYDFDFVDELEEESTKKHNFRHCINLSSIKF